MDTNSIILAIDSIHQQNNRAFNEKDLHAYASVFNEHLKYIYSDGTSVNKKQFLQNTESYFKKHKNISLEYYRIKWGFEDGVFTEKIAKKFVSQVSNLLILSKKQTVQTEETIKWQQIGGQWQIMSVEIGLEEKY